MSSNKEIILLSILCPTPRVGTVADFPNTDESQIGLTVRLKNKTIVIKTLTPKFDCLIEGLTIEATDNNNDVSSRLKQMSSQLISQCREISEKLSTYSTYIERLSKQQIPHINDKIQQTIKSNQLAEDVSDKHINKNSPSLVSSTSSSVVTPDLSLFE